MRPFLLAAAFSCGSAMAGVFYLSSMATPIISEARAEKLGAYCEAGVPEACEILAAESNGQCAGPSGSGCLYNSSVMR